MSERVGESRSSVVRASLFKFNQSNLAWAESCFSLYDFSSYNLSHCH